MKLPESFHFGRWGWWLAHAVAIPAVLAAGWTWGTRSGPPAVDPPPPVARPSEDTRERLMLSARNRDAVLLEMRRMLESVNGILTGVVADDAAAIGTAAQKSGVAMAADIDPRIMKSLPPMFRDLGMRTHRDFEALAESMRGAGSSQEAVEALAGLTGNCVGCHASYRIEQAPEPK